MSPYTAAISGNASISTELVSDALTDTLRATEEEVRLLVPATLERLSEGVQAVVEWAWEQGVHVVAFPGTEAVDPESIVGGLITDGADEVDWFPVINTRVYLELVNALPSSCLIVLADEDGFDAETQDLMARCFANNVPVFNLSEGMIEVDPYDHQDEEPELPFVPDEEKPDEAEYATLGDGEMVLPSSLLHILVSPDNEDIPIAYAGLRDDDWDLLQHGVKQVEKSARNLSELVQKIRGARPPKVSPKQKPRQPRTEYYDEASGTWKPRGRGRLRSDVKTRPAQD